MAHQAAENHARYSQHKKKQVRVPLEQHTYITYLVSHTSYIDTLPSIPLYIHTNTHTRARARVHSMFMLARALAILQTTTFCVPTESRVAAMGGRSPRGVH